MLEELIKTQEPINLIYYISISSLFFLFAIAFKNEMLICFLRSISKSE